MATTGPGGKDIADRIAHVYPGVKPAHFDVALPMRAGGARPLERISILKLDDAGSSSGRHWLYVSYGLSELHAKKSRRQDRSGWGLELTFRLKRGKEAKAPGWPLDLMQALAGYVFQSRSPFEAGGQMDLNGPIHADSGTALSGVVFALDPKLGRIEGCFGYVNFLQAIPVHAAELEACAAWNTAGVLSLLGKRDPWFVTDLARPSLLKDPANRQLIEKGIARDGSSLGTQVLDSLEWVQEGEAVRLRIGAYAVDALARMIADRTLHGKRFLVDGPQNLAVFDLAPACGWRIERKALVIELTEEVARKIHAALEPVRGEHTWRDLPGFTLEITPSEIRDPEGKVIRTIG